MTLNWIWISVSAAMSLLPIVWTVWLWDRLELEMSDRDPFVYLEVQCYCGKIYSITHYECVDKLSKHPPRRTLEMETFCCKDCGRTVWPLLEKTRWLKKCLQRYYQLKIPDPEPRQVIAHKRVTMAHLVGMQCTCVESGYAPHQDDPDCPEHGVRHAIERGEAIHKAIEQAHRLPGHHHDCPACQRPQPLVYVQQTGNQPGEESVKCPCPGCDETGPH
jgi:hypothetical protein